jgi:hypothetical protein
MKLFSFGEYPSSNGEAMRWGYHYLYRVGNLLDNEPSEKTHACYTVKNRCKPLKTLQYNKNTINIVKNIMNCITVCNI